MDTSNIGQSPLGQVAQNFSQDKLSLGATDHPVSLTIIPGKLDEEQKPLEITQLNKPSESGGS